MNLLIFRMFQLSPLVVFKRSQQPKLELHGREMAEEFCLKMSDFHVTFRDLLHAVSLRHGTNGFTSSPKEGMLKIFSPCKIQRLRPGLNPRTWVPKASTLPVDHRSRTYNLRQIFIDLKAVMLKNDSCKLCTPRPLSNTRCYFRSEGTYCLFFHSPATQQESVNKSINAVFQNTRVFGLLDSVQN